MARKKRKSDKELEELVAPDAFETAGATGVSWFEKNFKLLLAGVVAILVLILGQQYYSTSQARQQSEMTAALNEAIEAFGEAVDLRTVLTSTVPETLKAGYEANQKQFADFRSTYSDADASALAGLYEAELWRRLEEPAKAVPLYEKYLERLGEDAPHAFMAHEGAGYAYEQLEQLDKALSHFEKMEKYEYAKGYALKHQARVLEAKKDSERAQAVYRELSKLDGALKTFAEERLRMLE